MTSSSSADHPPLRWGVLSTASIGTDHVIPAIQASAGGEVAAIASRNIDKARRVASELDIPHAYGSYEALLDDPAIEAIYNPLPNHLHVHWSRNAIDAGKHVLCEKPLGIDREDATRLVAAAVQHPDLVVMEAFMYRFHPQWIAVKSLVDSGAIGDVRYISQEFSYFNEDPDNIRHKPEWGGGALLDIGCYPISQARHVLGREPSRVFGLLDIDPRFGTDRRAAAILDFGETTAVFTVATQAVDHQRCQLVGTTGRIEVDIPVNAPAGQPTHVTLVNGDGTAEHEFGPTDQYGAQTDAVAYAVRTGGSAPVPLEDALANMQVLDAVRTSHERTAWVDIEPG